MSTSIDSAVAEKPVKLLLVDDREQNLASLQAMLEPLGHPMITARSGPEALHHLLREEFALVLLDVNMPGMSGFEVATLIREREQTRLTPIIFVTANAADIEMIGQSYQAGGVDYLTKPLDVHILRSKVSVFVELAKSRQRLGAALAERERAYEQLRESREELRRKNEQMEEDLRMAREVQQAMLAQEYPAFPAGVPKEQSHLRFGHRYLSMNEVGGDFFNILSLSNTQALLFVADVMGHGVRSALVTAMLRAMLEEFKDLAPDPGRFLTQMNHDLHAILQRTNEPLFTTAFCLLADLEMREFRHASAGHPQPFILHRKPGTIEWLNPAGRHPGPALGIFPEARYETTAHTLADGDVVLLFTDGVFEVESPSGEEFGQKRLAEIARRRMNEDVDALLDGLLGEVREFADARGFSDDVCLLGAEVVGS
jgi:serine phosphatase RsbU (regulator of sigma subunit)/CheY-like chemotaxis protein